jgi:hypothetical protein
MCHIRELPHHKIFEPLHQKMTFMQVTCGPIGVYKRAVFYRRLQVECYYCLTGIRSYMLIYTEKEKRISRKCYS